MKCINKTGNILRNNSGETIVEVLVAFTLLSIIMLIFSQGIAFATNAEYRASTTRQNADEALKRIQHRLATGERDSMYTQIHGVFNDLIKVETYTETVDGQTYTYVYYEATQIGN